MKGKRQHILCILYLICAYTQGQTEHPLRFIGVVNTQGDTISFLSIFHQFRWTATWYKENTPLSRNKNVQPDAIEFGEADQIHLATEVFVDPSITEQLLMLEIHSKVNTQVRVNNKVIAMQIYTERNYNEIAGDVREINQPFFFGKSRNKLEVILVKPSQEYGKLPKGENAINNFGYIYIKTNQAVVRALENSKLNEKLWLIVTMVYLIIGLVTLLIFLYFKQQPGNMYFAVFCLLFAIGTITNQLELTVYPASVLFCMSAVSFGFLTIFIAFEFEGEVPKIIALKGFVIISFLLFILQTFLPAVNFSVVIYPLAFAYMFYSGMRFLYLLLRGENQARWESTYIRYGFAFALILIAGISLIYSLVFRLTLDGPVFNYLPKAGLLSIPLTLVTVIGKKNGLNQKQLSQQVIEISELSQQNLQKEKEKQIILENQNVLLEEQVAVRTVQLKEEKEKVQDKNREILDSISYAQRIQSSILPPDRFIKQHLPDSFVLYRPKDIVAGDFYWMETVGDIVLFAACDCTGHGVPGALVSVVCHNALTRCAREFGLTKPSDILDKTAELVVENFARSDEEIMDGMDISLCAFHKKENKLEWAGANNPLWMIRKSGFHEITADKQPIGRYEHRKPYANHSVSLEPDDRFFLFSDGYADQFGGENKRKKLTRRRFKELLVSIQKLSMAEQGIELSRFIDEYRNDLEQIDDILVWGVRIANKA
jgi:serine phosphatase RsbU (regulator of sigma subunit)